MPIIKKIAMIGLGLIGGSLAKALKRTNPDLYIKAFDKDRESLLRAVDDKVIDRACKDMKEATAGVQLIFICTPIDSIATLFNKLRDLLEPRTIVTDVGSTKNAVMESARELLSNDIFFIGGHPMAGTQYSGYGYSEAHLFENAFYVLTPMKDTPIEAVQVMVEIISSIGAFPLIMDSDVHDEVVGAVSHLPHVVASALVNAVAGIDDPSRFKERLAAGGFRDITRIASSNPNMWATISLMNRQKLLKLTKAMIEQLQSFYTVLKAQEMENINAFYQKGKDYRDKLPAMQSASLHPSYDMYVDIEDRPGIIGEVTSVLGDEYINIRNIRIIHSREHEPGCLIISLANSSDLDRAVLALKTKGYKAYKR